MNHKVTIIVLEENSVSANEKHGNIILLVYRVSQRLTCYISVGLCSYFSVLC